MSLPLFHQESGLSGNLGMLENSPFPVFFVSKITNSSNRTASARARQRKLPFDDFFVLEIILLVIIVVKQVL